MSPASKNLRILWQPTQIPCQPAKNEEMFHWWCQRLRERRWDSVIDFLCHDILIMMFRVRKVASYIYIYSYIVISMLFFFMLSLYPNNYKLSIVFLNLYWFFLRLFFMQTVGWPSWNITTFDHDTDYNMWCQRRCRTSIVFLQEEFALFRDIEKNKSLCGCFQK